MTETKAAKHPEPVFLRRFFAELVFFRQATAKKQGVDMRCCLREICANFWQHPKSEKKDRQAKTNSKIQPLPDDPFALFAEQRC
jgi:hypothetical protein